MRTSHVQHDKNNLSKLTVDELLKAALDRISDLTAKLLVIELSVRIA